MAQFLFRDSEVRQSSQLKIGGVYLPPCKSFEVQYYDLQTDSYRDITPNALLHKETIAWDKIKLVCEWGYLSDQEAKIILNCCKDNEFTPCEFYNPLTLEYTNILVYRGDRSAKIYRQLQNEDGSISIDYQSLTVNFIEQ